MATVCPYCNIEVSESSIEAEDGCCPECGSVISATSSFLGENDEFDEFEPGEDQDIFDDLDDDEDFKRGAFDGDFEDEEFEDEEFEDEEFAEEFEDEENF